jgi:hypothetical protein
MISGPSLPLRNERSVAGRTALTAPRTSAAPSADSDLTAEQQTQLAAQHAAFDYEAAERAEIEREHEVLQALLMAFLKNDALRTIATRGALLSVARRARAVSRR